ncbi:cation diffusion facilitator family transporter [Noviherbaspirillum pedocola]|uniref:Cation transporter n=1 Tax=Noviherbaspirillum pedocola TaxID=2801341 RepID=A0A934SSP3_9BURK|nr:cation diffusion facilitator family transporter [Noviherbaspirillum pedocola]MBK4734809.1 cation transporter [Noviherbaspirillum pedocola]
MAAGHHHHDHHGHGAHHHHAAPADHNRAFVFAILLNTAFVAIEFFYGFIAHSTALMADAGHNLSDVLGLGLSWAAALLAKKQPAGRYTYGLRSSSILAALGNAMLLLVACGGIALEAAQRFLHPEPVAGTTVSVVAAIGIVINGFSAWLFMSGSKGDLNVRSAFLHMAFDALVSLAVVASGLLMLYTGWFWIDPLLSLLILAVILAGTFGLLRDALRLSLNAVPPHIALDEVEAYLASLPGVASVHDLHVWGMSTTETALTAHLRMPGGYPGDAFLNDAARELEHQFSIHHTTLQINLEDVQHCALTV